MAIGWKQFGHSRLHDVASSDWMKHIIKAVISCIWTYRTRVFWSTSMLLRQQSTQKSTFWSNNVMSRHWSMLHQLVNTTSIGLTKSQNYNFTIYALHKVFNCFELKNAILFVVRLLINHKIIKIPWNT